MSKICMSFKCASLDYPKVRVEAIGIVIKTLETKGMDSSGFSGTGW